MKKELLVIFWMIVLGLVLVGLAVWGIFFVKESANKIAVFGIITAIIAAFTSVLTVNLENRRAKQRV